MKTTAESMYSAGKFGDPATAIESTKQATASLIERLERNDRKGKKGIHRGQFSFTYTWFLFNCPVTPPRQQSILHMTMNESEDVKKNKMLVSKNFKTSATYGTEALPFEEDVIAVFERPLTIPKVNTVFLSVNGKPLEGGLSKLLQHFMKENVPELGNLNVTNIRQMLSTLSHGTLGDNDRRNLAECNSHSLETEQKYYVRFALARKAEMAAKAKKI